MTEQQIDEYRRVHREFLALNTALADESNEESVGAKAAAILSDPRQLQLIEDSASRKLDFLDALERQGV